MENPDVEGKGMLKSLIKLKGCSNVSKSALQMSKAFQYLSVTHHTKGYA